MKRITILFLFSLVANIVSAAMPRSEWHAKVGECALDPVMLKSTISQLSSADKPAFLAEVNEAISKMPGSAEVKTAQFLSANRAAVVGAGSSDRGTVLAEVFATVPPESLTVINEEFAKNEFSRPAAMNDEQYTNVVSVAMAKIMQRCASAESGAVRAGFAGLMFVRAAGTASDSTLAVVVDALPQDSRADASGTWYPAALGKDQAPSYDPMLAASQAGEEPDHATVIAIYSPQIVESMLADLQSGVLPGEQTVGAKFGSIPANFYNFDTDAMNVRMIEPSRGRVLGRYIPESMLTGNPADRGSLVKNPYYSDGRHSGDRDGDNHHISGGGGGGEPGPYWLQIL